MTTKVYVGNLNYQTREDTLRTLFEEFGEVVSAQVIFDRATGRSKGFGFVEMESEDAAQQAISALNGKMVENREIKVDKANPRADSDRRGGDRRGGGDRWRNEERRPRW